MTKIPIKTPDRCFDDAHLAYVQPRQMGKAFRAKSLDLDNVPANATHVASDTFSGFKWFVYFRDGSYWILPSSQYGRQYWYASLFMKGVELEGIDELKRKPKGSQPRQPNPVEKIESFIRGGIDQACNGLASLTEKQFVDAVNEAIELVSESYRMRAGELESSEEES